MPSATAMLPARKVAREEMTAEDGWKEVERLVYKLVWKFQAKYGGDFDEMLSAAHLHFMRAFRRWIAENGIKKGPLSAWVAWKVHYGLLEECRRAAIRRRKQPRVRKREAERQALAQQPNFVKELLTNLSQDAKTAIRLCVMNKRRGVKGVEQTAREVLLDLGWSTLQIAKTWQEIREALAS